MLSCDLLFSVLKQMESKDAKTPAAVVKYSSDEKHNVTHTISHLK